MIDEGEIPFPANWNNINMRFGINLLFGNRIKKAGRRNINIVKI